MPSVPLTFSEDIYDNIYDSFAKLKLESKIYLVIFIGAEDLDEFLTQSQSIHQLNLSGIERRIQERRLILSNGYNPYQESKYWDEYQKYKNINQQKFEGFLERQQKIKDFNAEIAAVSHGEQEIIDIGNKFMEDISNEELGIPVSDSNTDKTLNMFIDD